MLSCQTSEATAFEFAPLSGFVDTVRPDTVSTGRLVSRTEEIVIGFSLEQISPEKRPAPLMPARSNATAKATPALAHFQTYLKQNSVPHTWNVDDNGHDSTSWRNNLYHFAQYLFR